MKWVLTEYLDKLEGYTRHFQQNFVSQHQATNETRG